MAQAYTAPDWTSGEGISASNLQSISNTLEGIVQGTDRAIHNVDINGSNLIVTYVDGTIENFAISGLKGISNVSKSSSGSVDTYTITYTDGSTYSFNVTNGGTLVVANPEMSGDEAAISSIQIGDEKFKIEGGGGGDASMVILSKAEYDALPDSKLTDGKQYFVEDWNSGSGSSQNIYPLDGEPVVIGKIGNYDLKRRYTTSMTTQFTSKDVIINVIGLFVNQNNQIVPLNYYFNSNWFTEWYFRQDNYTLVINKGSSITTFKNAWVDYYTTE